MQRLVDAGAVIVGKANLHEFAWGVTSKNPFYGTVGNPRRPGHVAGGSSGGSAAALAAGLAAVSLGSETGGSIRIPSAACGTDGFKPSYGRVPLDGCFPLATCFDHIGPMARTMAECALAFEVLTGAPTPAPTLAGLRVGVLGAIAEPTRLEHAGRCGVAATVDRLETGSLEQLPRERVERPGNDQDLAAREALSEHPTRRRHDSPVSGLLVPSQTITRWKRPSGAKSKKLHAVRVSGDPSFLT